MAETTTKTFKIKSGKMNASDGKEWVELIEERDGKEIKHRIFKNVQRNDETWVSLKDEVEILKEKIGNNEIEGMPISLIKEKRGEYWNVVGVEFEPIEPLKAEVQTGKAKPPQRKETAFAPSPEKTSSIEGQKAADITAQLFIANKLTVDNPLVQSLYHYLAEKLGKEIGIEIKVVETPTYKPSPTDWRNKPEPPKEISVADIKKIRDDKGWSNDDIGKFCRKEKKWNVDGLGGLNQEQRAELIEYIRKNPK